VPGSRAPGARRSSLSPRPRASGSGVAPQRIRRAGVRSLLWKEATSQSERASGAPCATYMSGRVPGQRRVGDGQSRPSTFAHGLSSGFALPAIDFQLSE
jgi:hypothetical protein